jgi:hypothetical protein
MNHKLKFCRRAFIFTPAYLCFVTFAGAQNIGIGTNNPFVPLHVKGQKAITLPNGGIETSHVTALINDTTPASGTGSKIGLYSIVKNHAAASIISSP